MQKSAFFDDLQQRLNELLENSPAADLKKNLRAMLMQQFSRMELVTQEEMDVQRDVLARTREKLEALEARVRQLESKPPQP
jgi:BMFP domain-containing protein YqiC